MEPTLNNPFHFPFLSQHAHILPSQKPHLFFKLTNKEAKRKQFFVHLPSHFSERTQSKGLRRAVATWHSTTPFRCNVRSLLPLRATGRRGTSGKFMDSPNS